MKEELVSFETAQLAKEKGFNIPTYTSYIDGKFHENENEPNGYDGWDLADKQNWNKNSWVFSKEGGSCFGCKLDNINYFEACSAPTQSLLQRWLREEHDIHIYTEPYWDEDNLNDPPTYQATWIGEDIPEEEIEEDFNYFKTYEEALEIGLLEALKLIK